MCEPAHSIVQYPTDFDSPVSSQLDKKSLLAAALGKGFGWAKKVGEYFHLSKFGAGHHENTGSLSYRSSIYLPDPVLWEGLWWKREFKFDGLVGWNSSSIPGSKTAAQEYHNSSAMGNMSLFRRFLETSMRKSSCPYVYVETMLENVLTSEGVNKLLEKFRRVFGQSTSPAYVMSRSSSKQQIEKAIKVVMGFTRQRRLFLPHFSDDDSLWVSGGRTEG